MNIGIYYFSGTGNTRFIAEEMQRNFGEQGSTCELIPIETITKGEQPLELGSFDLVGIGFPVHAYDAPSIVYSFLELLPNARMGYFLFKTAGDKFLYGGSTNRLRKVLAHKSWKLVHESFYAMPANMASNPKAEKIAYLVDAAKLHASLSVSEILARTRIVLPDTTTQRVFSLINRAESRGCRKGSRFWTANNNCIQCGKCVHECPTKNIEMTDGKVVFADKCIFCLRCWWNCPTRAISHPYAKFVMLKQPYTLPK